MKPVKIYPYDGSFRSFLSTMYEILHSDETAFHLSKAQKSQQPGLFGVEINEKGFDHSKKVWEALRRKAVHLPRLAYFAFLSEEAQCDKVLADYLCLVFGHPLSKDLDRTVLQRKLTKWARAVEQEKTELENSLLFISARKRIPECHIAPKHNVLPLLSRHFRMRYGHGSWMIVDRKRKYGLYGNNGEVTLVRSGWEEMRNVPVNTHASVHASERSVRQAI